MSKKITVKARPREHTHVERDEGLDTEWEFYYEEVEKMAKWKERLSNRTQHAIDAGKTLYNVTWVAVSMIPDKVKMMAFYKSEEWIVPQITEPDYKSMTQYMKDEEIEFDLWKKERKGFPQKPRKMLPKQIDRSDFV